MSSHKYITPALALSQEVVPQLSELDLLRDALKQLDDLFLVVVVGEFNSGKKATPDGEG